ncbi:ATP-binding cassette domain-containing protein [Arcanobacterium hippocoleae]|uniref:ATP-binding cassette domain-containing protein n=1 Tax=Arcanobacterium hippocoleae TaxID=149017 RepID=UPI00333E82EE
MFTWCIKKILSAQGRKIVIRNAEFSLASGKIGAVFGFSGSGKSNLLEIIGGLQKVDAGEVVVAGTDLTTLTRDEILSFRRNLISFVFESDNLIPDLQVQENLELPFILAKKRFQDTTLKVSHNFLS